jgi:hypothetical protein
MSYLELIIVISSNFFSFLLGWLFCAIFTIDKIERKRRNKYAIL